MFHHLSSNSSESPSFAILLDKLASQPNGLENALKLAAMLTSPQPEPQSIPEAANRKRLIAIAMRLVKEQEIEAPPYFKGMSDDAICEFIAKYSPEYELG